MPRRTNDLERGGAGSLPRQDTANPPSLFSPHTREQGNPGGGRKQATLGNHDIVHSAIAKEPPSNLMRGVNLF